MLIEHPALKPLMPFYVAALEKSLVVVKNKGKSVQLDALSHYSFNIFQRAHEIDNSLKKINLALEYLSRVEYENSHFKFTEHYAYHVERLLIEFFSTNERCWLLVGTSLLLEKNEIERIGSKAMIKKKMSAYKETEISFEKIDTLLKKHRKSRNDIAHNKSYSNRYLTYILYAENGNAGEEIEKLIDKIDINTLLEKEFTTKFKSDSDMLKRLINELLDSLAPLYKNVSSKVRT